MKLKQLSNFTNKNTGYNNNKTEFKGGAGTVLDLATKGLTTCDKYPMVSVAVTDTVTSIAPRTALDLKTGVPAAMETFRRESSGLLVNCLLPSFFVLGVSKLLGKPIMGETFRNSNMTASWANGETLDKFSDVFKSVINPNSKTTTKDEIHSFVKSTFENLEGLDGKNWVKFSDKLDSDKSKHAINIITDAIMANKEGKKATKDAISKATNLIAEQTHATQNLKFNGKHFGSNLSEIIRDQIDLGRKFTDTTVRENLDDFVKNSKKLVNSKSILGLAVIIPLAMSMQYINRAITRHKYKVKGAPIYKDFEKGDTHKEMSPAQKAKFFTQKVASGASMFGLAVLSMMKKPTMQMFQFKGMFPTVDQCRWIASSTFASRFFAAEDPNELRESTVRDMASFAGLYFLGDYAAKATGTIIEKARPDIKLLNKNYISNEKDNFFKKAGNWIKNTSLKSFGEIDTTVKGAKNMRSLCQLASLGFSIVTLGLILPAYNRHVTNKKVEKQKAIEAAQKASLNTSLAKTLKNEKSFAQNGVYNKIAANCFNK